MIRSLRTGISGLKTNQVRMDVVGNNIANVNTTAFKRGRAAFSEVLGQQMLGLGRTAGGSGINPSFVGLGVATSSITQNWSQGSIEATNVATDVALNGDGYFIVRSMNSNLLSRDGNFTFNADGMLVTNSGLNVQGFAFDENGEVDMSQLQDVQVNWASQAPPKLTENVRVGGNLSSDTAAGEVRTISTAVYDEQGEAHNTIIELTKSATDNEWTYNITYGGDLTPAPFAPTTGTLTFNVDGTLQSPPALTINWDPGYVTGGGSYDIDLTDMTQYSGSTTVTVRDQDGYGSGQLMGYGIDPNGQVVLNYSNGEQETIFQLAVGTVNNPNGLEQRGENYYGLSAASGELVLGRAGNEVNSSVVSGALEQSNVDLATEFTEMIVAQRGYQAAARVVTTSDELLQETVSLKR